MKVNFLSLFLLTTRVGDFERLNYCTVTSKSNKSKLSYDDDSDDDGIDHDEEDHYFII